jgi:hypothetical protein
MVFPRLEGKDVSQLAGGYHSRENIRTTSASLDEGTKPLQLAIYLVLAGRRIKLRSQDP